jgi:two-component system, OmpR family, alkaline phosphatase synthesis response regulator PhoP
MGKRILLVEDEPGLTLTLTDRLRVDQYEVETAEDGEVGLQRALDEPFDLIILDIMLPRKSGLDVCRDLRQRNNRTPVLMLTARGEVIDRVVGLKLGADDYLVKPFEMLELLARIEALLRRTPGEAPVGADSYQFEDVRIDFRRAEVTRGGSPVELSAREYHLLQYLINHRETVISREELLEQVWGYQATPLTRTVDVHIAWLRQKLETNPRHPQYILTVHGLGYKFIG